MSSTARHTKADVVSDFRRAQILDAARQTFVRHGVAHTTVEGIAREAGVAKGTVYLYYKSKDEILRQLLSADLAELQDDTLPGITGGGTLETRLAAFFRAALVFFERKRDFIDHCQIEMTAEVRKKARQKLGFVFAAQTDAWQRALESERTAGRVAIGDAPGAARAIVSLAHGLAIQRLRGWHPASVDEVVRSTTALILNGVIAR
jgi:TetR/AcrR family fatty acid metabolism transcriptional regulator